MKLFVEECVILFAEIDVYMLDGFNYLRRADNFFSMETITIYHNPRCMKSRAACALLTKQNVDYKTIEYLKQPLAAKDLKTLLKKLGIPAAELVRKTEAVFKETYKGKNLTENEWIAAMIAHPKLIERPIVVKGDKAVIGRPTEKVVELLS